MFGCLPRILFRLSEEEKEKKISTANREERGKRKQTIDSSPLPKEFFFKKREERGKKFCTVRTPTVRLFGHLPLSFFLEVGKKKRRKEGRKEEKEEALGVVAVKVALTHSSFPYFVASPLPPLHPTLGATFFSSQRTKEGKYDGEEEEESSILPCP